MVPPSPPRFWVDQRLHHRPLFPPVTTSPFHLLQGSVLHLSPSLHISFSHSSESFPSALESSLESTRQKWKPPMIPHLPTAAVLFLSSLCSRTSRKHSLWSLFLVPSCSFTSFTLQPAVSNLASIPTYMETVLFKVSRIHVDNPVVPSVFMFFCCCDHGFLETPSTLELIWVPPAWPPSPSSHCSQLCFLPWSYRWMVSGSKAPDFLLCLDTYKWTHPGLWL